MVVVDGMDGRARWMDVRQAWVDGMDGPSRWMDVRQAWVIADVAVVRRCCKCKCAFPSKCTDRTTTAAKEVGGRHLLPSWFDSAYGGGVVVVVGGGGGVVVRGVVQQHSHGKRRQ